MREGGKDDYNFEWSPEAFYDHRDKKWNFKGAKDGSEWNGRKDGQPFFGQIQLAGGKLGRGLSEVVDRGSVPVPPYYPDIPLVREEIAHHYDCLLETDAAVGRIIAALKRDGLYENTVIFMFSDHGYLLHRHKQYRMRAASICRAPYRGQASPRGACAKILSAGSTSQRRAWRPPASQSRTRWRGATSSPRTTGHVLT